MTGDQKIADEVAGEVLDEFSAENPDVKMTWGQWADLHDRIRVAMLPMISQRRDGPAA